MTRPTVTAYDWVPPFARGHVRDLRVRWALEEAGQPYDVLYLGQGEQKEPTHRARQPFGQVPTYEEDGLILFESGAIVLHIAERFGGGLLPSDGGARARAIEWMFAALNTIEPQLIDYGNCVLFEAGEPWSKTRLPSVVARIDQRLAELSARLGGGDWLDGAFTAGDLVMVCALRTVASDGLLDKYANLTAYVARGEARPAFGRALDAQMSGFTGEPPAHLREWLKQFETQSEGEQA